MPGIMLNSWDFSGFKSSQSYQMGIISILTVETK